jgi:hypothetical protein
MKNPDLVKRILDAKEPEELRSALAAAKEYLKDNPGDFSVHMALTQLVRIMTYSGLR